MARSVASARLALSAARDQFLAAKADYKADPTGHNRLVRDEAAARLAQARAVWREVAPKNRPGTIPAPAVQAGVEILPPGNNNNDER